MNFKEQILPKNFKTHTYTISFNLPVSKKVSNDWLLKKRTFTSGQLPPYKVEFLPESEDPFMKVGDLTNHHGPLISFAGVMTEVNSEYRRLDYYYGSYAFTFRLVRPISLEVWTKEISEHQSEVTLQLSTGVRSFFKPVWAFLMWFFWPQFALNAKLLWFFKKHWVKD